MHKLRIHWLAPVVAALMTVSVQAQAQVAVKDPWVRATVPNQKATGAFMQLTSPSGTRLVAVKTPLTPKAEVHEMLMEDNIMRMRQVAGIDLPAGKVVELKSGGYHLMLLDLPSQVKAGDSVPLTLIFEDKSGRRQTQDVIAPVREINTMLAPKDEHSGHQH
ncbi:copper chaperone PCu(A)C [Roseateles sp. SL47]|uniref:copper chaperone PCu(A)C n=1 Tax=Roseateles sp. SL47 TaxID=2995138 RepID=UPI00226E5B0C|nr:copper chaperone PCu(A)C [Roseateles sp. SL47]WAC73086.1 copper chaperone PCu(A)C [Roseateles sp. SL47]